MDNPDIIKLIGRIRWFAFEEAERMMDELEECRAAEVEIKRATHISLLALFQLANEIEKL